MILATGAIPFRAAGILFCAILLALPALGLETDRRLEQYMHGQFETEHGLPQNAVHCITQDHAGYLWLGTENGLVRFDGVDFEVFTEQSEPRVPNNYVSSLLTGRDGSVWAGTRTGGLCRYRAGKFEIPILHSVSAVHSSDH